MTVVSKFFIHATNVHQGGGRTLLEAVFSAIPHDQDTILILDERMPLPRNMTGNIVIRRCRPTIGQRLLAEKWLANNVQRDDFVLCFGNLPPLFRLRAFTVLFLQNRYLIDYIGLGSFPLGIRLRLAVERLWLLVRRSNIDELVVQTPTMKDLAAKKMQGRVQIRMLPFVAVADGYVRKTIVKPTNHSQEFDFVYVATGETHKNHHNLISAWCSLAAEGIFPSLCLTLDGERFGRLCEEIEKAKKDFGIKVVNLGVLSHSNVLTLYRKAGALIFPSVFESFGMPLIEARQAGLPILASELDYVRDVVDPEQAFDPESPSSIARAVKRFLGIRAEELPLLDASMFLQNLLDLRGGRS